MATDRDSVISKIRKLLALSQSNNQHEAELAAAKASELMQEYQIEISDTTVEAVDTEIQKDVIYTKRAKWCFILACGCAELFDSDALFTQRDATRISFVGTRTNIDAAKMMYEYLLVSWGRISDHDLAVAQSNGLYEHGKAFKAAHGLGYAKAIRHRANRLARERKETVKAHSAGGTALIVQSDKALVEYMTKFVIATNRSYSLTSDNGFNAGVSAGNSIHLGGFVGGTAAVGRLR